MPRTVVLGLTGSIGMGKSTTAAMFAALGVPVWDADAAVHRLYSPGGAAALAIAPLFPMAVGANGVDRNTLKRLVSEDPSVLERLEGIVHPLVAEDRRRFIERAAAAGAPLVVIDVPLLFETGADSGCDATLVVSVPEDVQRARVLSRPGMTEADFERLHVRQLPDAEKRARATHVIETLNLDDTRNAVRKLVETYVGASDARDRS